MFPLKRNSGAVRPALLSRRPPAFMYRPAICPFRQRLLIAQCPNHKVTRTLVLIPNPVFIQLRGECHCFTRQVDWNPADHITHRGRG